MENKNEVRISVRNLVEFILRRGSIDSRFMSMNRAVEGTKAHRKVQKFYEEGYEAEVFLRHTVELPNFFLTVEGRADGILKEHDSIIIDEIKTVTRSINLIDEEYNPLHWAQAKCYGYIYGVQNGLDEIYVQLTYFQIDTEEVKKIRKKFTIDELEKHFYDLIHEYCLWANFIHNWIEKRNSSIKELKFPFKNYRKGQREMAVAVYRTIANGEILFAQAPTGIGKTISTIFPAVKAIGEGLSSKIFYLTAKTTLQAVAEETFHKMKENGLQFKTVTITAKDKICFKEKSNCNPEYCEFAQGHFDRVNEAIFDILRNENELSRDKIVEYSQKHRVCPFEYSLDLSLWADCVICDYNYLFDPSASLKRFFLDKGGDYIFLIDEAHNLAGRAREMFSAQLTKKPILELRKELKDKNKGLYSTLNDINKYMINLRRACEESGYIVKKNEEKELYSLLRNFIDEAEEYLPKNQGSSEYEKLLSLYFDVYAFLKISELFDERYVTFIEKDRDDVKIKLYCLDPSHLISEVLKKGKAAVFFSATLMPLDYFKEILGGEENSKTINLSSPFDVKNRFLLIADKVSTRYVNRANSYSQIVEYIKAVVSEKQGNYMVFFPSYQYMNEVYERFVEKYPNYNVNLQIPSMTEEEKSAFIEFFEPNPKEVNIGFCVLGGIYSEGIDLKDDRLIGVIIVGVGLPQIGPDRDILRDYYDKKNNMGFEYAYMYPGMNKVMQAAGRLIRSERDRGVILLIDERFGYPSYQRLFPKEWFPNTKVDINSLSKVLHNFWNKH
jgi:DNA excision repair protein ERCC-2